MRFVIIIAVILAAILGLAAWGPGSLNAMHFEPPLPDPALAARFETETAPLRQEREDLHGAEDLEPGPDGRLYASLADGRIMARSPSGDWEMVAETGGRPLGLAFGPDGTLFVADARLGLLRQTEGGWQTWLAPAPDGPLVFPDDLTVLEDGRIVMTDASLRHGYGDHMASFLEGDQTGRVLLVTGSGAYEELAAGLGFINGADHDPETGLVYLNETWAGRIWQLDPETGEMSVLIEGLPGYPDNLEFDPESGLIWAAMPSSRAMDLEALHPRPFVKRLAWRWIQLAGPPPLPARPPMTIAVDTDGRPALALRGPDDGADGVTTALVWNEELWTAGLARDGITVFPVPGGDE